MLSSAASVVELAVRESSRWTRLDQDHYTELLPRLLGFRSRLVVVLVSLSNLLSLQYSTVQYSIVTFITGTFLQGNFKLEIWLDQSISALRC